MNTIVLSTGLRHAARRLIHHGLRPVVLSAALGAPLLAAAAGGAPSRSVHLSGADWSSGSPNRPPCHTTEPLDAAALGRCGKALRRAIDREYARRDSQHLLKAAGNGGNNIEAVVQPYLPVGMRLDHAQAILRAAGFTVSGPKPLIFDYFGAEGEIPQYIVRSEQFKI